jgi:uncharacterized protein (DUF849 family)
MQHLAQLARGGAALAHQHHHQQQQQQQLQKELAIKGYAQLADNCNAITLAAITAAPVRATRPYSRASRQHSRAVNNNRRWRT